MRNRSIGSLILSPTAFTLALGMAATSEAALVPFDLNSMGLSGQNAGLTNGTGKLVYPWTGSAAFVVSSQAPRLSSSHTRSGLVSEASTAWSSPSLPLQLAVPSDSSRATSPQRL